MNREQRRAEAKAKKCKPPRRYAHALPPVARAIIEADYRAKFSKLKQAAEVQCLASDDTVQIAADAGYLLFITLRALELEQFELEDAEVIEGLALMGNALADINEAGAIEAQQRAELVTGMNYLDALVQVLSKEAIAVAWHQVKQAAGLGDIDTEDLDGLLQKLSQEAA